LYLEIVVSQKF